MPRKHFSLTHVEYDSEDPLGFILSLVTLSPVFIMVMYATLIAFRRDFHTIFLCLGQILCEILNQILKRVFDQPRPEGTRMTDAGMPSAHSQFMMFFATYVLLFLANKVVLPRKLEKLMAGFGVYLLAILVAYSRYHLGYHSLDQILAGCAFGTTFGIVWYSMMVKVLGNSFVNFEELFICKFFLLRDNSQIPDIIGFEYRCSKSFRDSISSKSKKKE